MAAFVEVTFLGPSPSLYETRKELWECKELTRHFQGRNRSVVYMAGIQGTTNGGKHNKSALQKVEPASTTVEALVFSWLQQVFGQDPIPQFEINNFTLSVLEQLANRNQEQNKHAEIITKDYIQKATEYAAEVERLSRIMEQVGLPVSSMSQSGRMSLKTLASVALLLGTKNCSTSSLLLGIAEQSQALSAAIDANSEEKRLLSRLLIKTKKAQTNVSGLQRSLGGLQDQMALQAPKLKKNAQETDFVKLKCKEYEKINKELEGYQSKVQLDSSIFHGSLVKKSEEVRIIKEKMKPIKSKLEGYHSLPPDISQARVKVEEAKMQLEMLEQQLSISIDTLHL